MTTTQMDTGRFWSIVDATCVATNQDDQLNLLAEQLSRLSQADLLAYHARYHQTLADANRWDLWGAAYVINGGCGDDGFRYFRDWLISCGRKVYEDALSDPQSLARYAPDMDGAEAEFESFCYVADEVHEERFGSPIEQEVPDAEGEPVGQPWDEDEVYEMFPELASAYDN